MSDRLVDALAQLHLRAQVWVTQNAKLVQPVIKDETGRTDANSLLTVLASGFLGAWWVLMKCAYYTKTAEERRVIADYMLSKALDVAQSGDASVQLGSEGETLN